MMNRFTEYKTIIQLIRKKKRCFITGTQNNKKVRYLIKEASWQYKLFPITNKFDSNNYSIHTTLVSLLKELLDIGVDIEKVR